MTSRVTNISVDAADPLSLADFWCAVLGWEIADESDEGVTIAPADRTLPFIDIFPVPDPKVHKNRLHLDLRADGSSTSEELERLLALGASTVDVGQPPEATWVVLADPEGNEFCLLSTSVQDLVP
jgi:predicted enzyme related to lactoylglutathione lyase